MKPKRHGLVAIVAGREKPAMSIQWLPPISPVDSGFSVLMAAVDPSDPNDATESELVCLACLVEDGDLQLGQGLDMARAHGHVDYDAAREEWFVP